MISVKPPAIDRGLCTLDMPKNAIDVAIGSKADMAYCGANVRL
jgi:hypothetical protein